MATPAYKHINNDAVTAIYNKLTALRIFESDFDNRGKVKSIWFTHRLMTGEINHRKFVSTFTIILRFDSKTKVITWEFDDEYSYNKCKELAMVGTVTKIFNQPFMEWVTQY